MKKKVITIICAAAFALSAGIFSACEKQVPPHEHTFESEWRHNSQSHWHNCTYPGCNVRGDEEEHSDWELIEATEEATCYTRGSGKWRCKVCGQEKTDIIEPTGEHIWQAEWQKSADEHFKKCTQRGCTAEIRAPHVAAEPVDVEPVESYRDGRTVTYCKDCDYILDEKIVPATNVAHAFSFSFTSSSDNNIFFYYDYEDDRIHCAVIYDDNGINVVRYSYKYSDGKKIDGSDVRGDVYPYSAGAKAGVTVMATDAITGRRMELWGPNSPSGTISKPIIWYYGNEAGRAYIARFQEYDTSYNMRLSYIYGDNERETCYIEFVVDVRRRDDHNAFVSQWLAAHPDFDPAEHRTIRTGQPKTDFDPDYDPEAV